MRLPRWLAAWRERRRERRLLGRELSRADELANGRGDWAYAAPSSSLAWAKTGDAPTREYFEFRSFEELELRLAALGWEPAAPWEDCRDPESRLFPDLFRVPLRRAGT